MLDIREKCVIFGCGKSGKNAYYSLKSKYEVCAFCDNNPLKWEEQFLGLPIISPKKLAMQPFQKVVVASVYQEEIICQLIGIGMQDIEYIDKDSKLLFKKETKEQYLNHRKPYQKKKLKKVLFVQRTPCIRTYKIACMLDDEGIMVDLAFQVGSPEYVYAGMRMPWKRLIPIYNLEEFVDFVNASDYDVIHHSNEPDSLADLLLHSNKKVVHDVHDMMSFRSNISMAETVQEFITNRYSDGVLYVSEAVREEACRMFHNEHKKTFVLENTIYGKNTIEKSYEKLSSKDGKIHCVYEGGVSAETWHHRYYEEIFPKLAEAGAEVHFYTSQDDKYCRKLESMHEGIHYEGHCKYNELINELTKYDVGLVAFNITERNYKQLHSSSPNKLYDYLLAGIPVAVAELRQCIRFVEEYHVGGELKWDEDLMAQMKRITKSVVPKDFITSNKIMMNESVGELIAFYESVAFDY